MSGCTEHVVPSHSWGTHQSAQCGAKCRVPRTQAVDDVTSRAVRSWSARARGAVHARTRTQRGPRAQRSERQKQPRGSAPRCAEIKKKSAREPLWHHFGCNRNAHLVWLAPLWLQQERTFGLARCHSEAWRPFLHSLSENSHKSRRNEEKPLGSDGPQFALQIGIDARCDRFEFVSGGDPGSKSARGGG